MRTSRFTEEQIIGIIREYEAGAQLAELCRRHNVSQTTFYKWRAKYWTDPLRLDEGMVRDQAALRALISSNRAGLR